MVRHTAPLKEHPLRKKSMDSGSICLPPFAFGSASWHSGMVLPQNRIPSSESRTEGSQSMTLRPRMPPKRLSTLMSPRLLSPCSARNFFTASCLSGMTSASVSMTPCVVHAVVRVCTSVKLGWMQGKECHSVRSGRVGPENWAQESRRGGRGQQQAEGGAAFSE